MCIYRDGPSKRTGIGAWRMGKKLSSATFIDIVKTNDVGGLLNDASVLQHDAGRATRRMR